MNVPLLVGFAVALGFSSSVSGALILTQVSAGAQSTAAPAAPTPASKTAAIASQPSQPSPGSNGWYGAQEPVGAGGGRWTCDNRTKDGVTTVDASADGCVPVGGKCLAIGGTYSIPALNGKCPVGVVPPDPTMYQIPSQSGACQELVDVPNQEYGKVVRTPGIRVFSGDASKNDVAQKLACPPRNGKCFNFAGDPVMPMISGACPSRGVVYDAKKAVAYVAKKNADSGRKTKSQAAAGI